MDTHVITSAGRPASGVGGVRHSCFLLNEAMCVAESIDMPVDLTSHQSTVGGVTIFDPGGTSTVQSYLDRYEPNNPETDNITSILATGTTHRAREQDITLAADRSRWRWTEAVDPLERDSTVAINPGFIRALYSQWATTFTDYDVQIAVDLTEGPPHSCDPSNPEQIENPATREPTLTQDAQERLKKAVGLASWMHDSPGSLSQEDLYHLLVSAYVLADDEYGSDAAEALGKGFKLPVESMSRDPKALLKHGGDLIHLAEATRLDQAATRLTLQRIELSLNRLGVSGSSPRALLSSSLQVDFARLSRLAMTGIPLPTYEGFKPTGKPREYRPLYKKVHGCVNRSLVELWREFLVFFIPTVLLCRVFTHFTVIGWTTKSGKPQGRQLFDARDDRGGSPLNPRDRKTFTERIREEWGPITNASLADICNMILSFEDDMRIELGDEFDLAEVVLCKADLKGAFHLLSFSAASVPLLACQLYEEDWPEFTEEMVEVLRQLGIVVTADTPRDWSMVYGTGSFAWSHYFTFRLRCGHSMSPLSYPVCHPWTSLFVRGR